MSAQLEIAVEALFDDLYAYLIYYEPTTPIFEDELLEEQLKAQSEGF